MPDQVGPINQSPEDRFADDLDAFTLGLSARDSGDMSFLGTARLIEDRQGSIGRPSDVPVSLDRAAKNRIWSDLMRERGRPTSASPVPQSPGAAGSTLTPNPWTSRTTPTPKRPRPSTGSLRFIPAAQPASHFLLLIVVLALIGGAFAILGPNGGEGIFPTALATEHPAQVTPASPEAPSTPDACLVERPAEVSADPLRDGRHQCEGVEETGAQKPRITVPGPDASSTVSPTATCP